MIGQEDGAQHEKKFSLRKGPKRPLPQAELLFSVLFRSFPLVLLGGLQSGYRDVGDAAHDARVVAAARLDAVTPLGILVLELGLLRHQAIGEMLGLL